MLSGALLCSLEDVTPQLSLNWTYTTFLCFDFVVIVDLQNILVCK